MNNIFGQKYQALDVQQSTILKPEIESMTLTGLTKYLNCLEGYKTLIKNFHWSSGLLSSYMGDPIHLRLDELLDEVNDYQDKIAEGGMGIYGMIPIGAICGEMCTCFDPIEMLGVMLQEAIKFYEQLEKCENRIKVSGLISETEVFIQTIHKYKFLFNICKTK